jgi:Cu/Ag efflux protein CusF
MKRISAIALHRIFFAAAAAFVINGAAQAADTVSASDVVKVTAKVTAIDQATRVVTLQDASGKKVTFVASDEVRNLDHVKVGDVVTMEYAQALAVSLKKSTKTSPQRSVTEGVTRAASGMKPGGVAVREVMVTAAVVAIDPKTNVVTLRGPDATVDVKVQDPSVLAGFKPGDFVDAVYREALAVKVEEAKK